MSRLRGVFRIVFLVGAMVSGGFHRMASGEQEDAAFDLYLNALRNQGRNPNLIWSGQLVATVVIEKPIPSLEEQRKYRKIEIQMIERAIKSARPGREEAVAREFQPALDDAKNRPYETPGEFKLLKVVQSLAFIGNDPHRKSRLETEYVERNFPSPTILVSGLHALPNQNRGKQVVNFMELDEGGRLATISTNTYESPEFQTYGRIRGRTPYLQTALFLVGEDTKKFVFNTNAVETARKANRLAVQGKIRGTQGIRIIGKEILDGHETVIIDTPDPGYKNLRGWYGRLKVWIDSERGFICPRIEEWHGGKLSSVYESKDYWKDQASGLYYPGEYKETEYEPQTGEVTRRTTFQFDKDKCSLNIEIDSTKFDLILPPGGGVVDKRNGGRKDYGVLQSESLTLRFDEQGNIDLSKIAGLVDSSTIQIRPFSNIAEGKTSNLSLILAVNGVFFILLAIFLLFRWRVKKVK
jgi:hypothetical protein